MQSLQTLIDLIGTSAGVHISILDQKGVLQSRLTRLSFRNVIHSTDFCTAVKSTDRGYRACLRCKKLANRKALSQKDPFAGECIFGLWEAALPIVKGDEILAVIYVGNTLRDEKESFLRLEKSCAALRLDPEPLREIMKGCPTVSDREALFRIAEIVGDYLRLLLAAQEEEACREEHWLVSLMKHYAAEEEGKAMTLKEIAALHGKNEKYLGRLFRRETGVGFCRYHALIRLEKAQALLSRPGGTVLDVALSCGFENLTYFYRLFRKEYGTTPLEYRKKELERRTNPKKP